MESCIRSRPPSILLMGSKPGSVVAFEVAMQRGWEIKGVVVSKEDPHPWLPGVRLNETAENNNIPVYTQNKLPPDLRADLVISYMYRNKVRLDVLERADIAALNFHAAPLPEYGGYAFYNVAILENATEYGCTCHFMDSGFDTGDICKVRKFKVDTKLETAVSLEKRSQIEMIKLFVSVLRLVESGSDLPRFPQDKNKMRYLDLSSFQALKQIPAEANAETIDRVSRAFFYPPYAGATMEIEGKKIEVLPDIVKQNFTKLLYADDYENIKLAAAADCNDG